MGRPPGNLTQAAKERQRRILAAMNPMATRRTLIEAMQPDNRRDPQGEIPGITSATEKTIIKDFRALVDQGRGRYEPKRGAGESVQYFHVRREAEAFFDRWRQALIVQEMLGELKVLPALPGPCGGIPGKLPHARAFRVSHAKLTGLACRQWEWGRRWEQLLGPYAMETVRLAVMAGRWPEGYLPGRPSWWGERLWDAMNADPFPAEEKDG